MNRQVSIINDFSLEKMEQPCCYSFLNFASLTSFYAARYTDQVQYFCDGILMAKLVSILSGRRIERVSFDFTSIAGVVFEYIECSNKSMYILGANESEINHFCQKIQTRYPNLNLIGYRSGYFSPEESGQVIEQIAILKPDYVLVGLGAGKQEQFGCALREVCRTVTIFTCGGFIRQESSSSKNYYPKLIDKLNLRAFYRMYKEPHTIRRYLFDYPRNAISFIFYHITGKIKIDING